MGESTDLILEVYGKIYAYRSASTSEHALLVEREAECKRIQDDIDNLNELNKVYRMCVEEQVNVKEDIDQLSTLFLQAMFDETYSFKYEPVEKEGILVGLRPTVYECGVPKAPKKQGGGCQNVLSLANRLVFVLLNSKLSPVVFLDEWGTNLDAPKWDQLVPVLQELRKKTKFQFGVISHSGTKFPQTFLVTRPSKVSKVVEV
jgi:DNA repair exonuclease SbcCD ATPase subunit